MLQPYLLFPFGWLWVLFMASLGVAMLVAKKLPEAWHVGRCDNCGNTTCAACEDSQTGIRLCRDCAAVIAGLASIKVMEALLRTRRQKVAVLKQKARSRRALFFPGVSNTQHGRIFSGAALSLLGSGAITLLLWKGAYFKDIHSLTLVQPVWSMFPPLAALAVGYILSFRAKAPQEQRNYHIFPAEIRMQEHEKANKEENKKTAAPPDPWKGYDGGKAAREESTPSFDSEPVPKKAPPREEALVGTIEKGSKWH